MWKQEEQCRRISIATQFPKDLILPYELHIRSYCVHLKAQIFQKTSCGYPLRDKTKQLRLVPVDNLNCYFRNPFIQSISNNWILYQDI